LRLVLRYASRGPAIVALRMPGRASCQDDLPAVTGSDGLAKDIHVLAPNHALVRRHRSFSHFEQQLSAGWRAVGEFEDAAVRLARICKGFALDEVDRQQLLASPYFAQADRPPLAIMEDVRGFVDHEVLNTALFVEVLHGHVAGRLLA
jgi:hypothetical protein